MEDHSYVQGLMERLTQSGGLREKGCVKQSLDNMPLVTVVTVVYNGGKTIQDTIKSIINQTYANIEYIIVDGASTDNTLNIIRQYEAYIDYWISEPDGGIYDAMNKGIGFARGELIGLLNSDDWYELDACSRIVAEYNASRADVFFGDLVKHYHDGMDLLISVMPPVKKETLIIHDVHPTVFVKSQAYQRYGLFNTKYKIAADYDLLLRFFEQGCQFQKAKGLITHFRMGGASSTGNTRKDFLMIAIEHDFSSVAIFQKMFAYIYVKIVAPIKVIFPFISHYKRKYLCRRKHSM